MEKMTNHKIGLFCVAFYFKCLFKYKKRSELLFLL